MICIKCQFTMILIIKTMSTSALKFSSIVFVFNDKNKDQRDVNLLQLHPAKDIKVWF